MMAPPLPPKPTAAEVLACLERSGYLLESRLVRQLVANGFFVEPNQAILDRRTGKSREIDIIAEHYNVTSPRHEVLVKSRFVIEACNNRLPVVLLTERPDSPVLAPSENYIKVGCTPEPFPYYGELECFKDRLQTRGHVFSQFCAISEKKSGNLKELMATHPEDLYGSILKLSEYVQTVLDHWNSEGGLAHSERFKRIFFWHPLLVLGGELRIAKVDQRGEVSLEDASTGFLEFNWHANEVPQTTLIEFVTATTLPSRLAELIEYDAALEAKAHDLVVGSSAR